MEKNITFLRQAMKNETVLEDIVVLTQKDAETDEAILAFDFNGYKGVIEEDEVDLFMEWKSLERFVGQEVIYVVIGIDEENETVYCSRKKAQELRAPETMAKLAEGATLEGRISGIVKYGAYVEIDGLYGLVKNSDFSDYHIPIGEVMKVGDTMDVTLKKVSKNEKLTFEPVEKYVIETIMTLDSFERDQVVLGEVNGVKPWGAYVNIAPGLDALCPIPPTDDIEVGMKVSFRITKVDKEKGRVRGKILRVL